MSETFRCVDCQRTKPVQTEGGTGYGVLADDSKVCYDCIGLRDAKTMIEVGHSRNLPLYFVADRIAETRDRLRSIATKAMQVSNWPGTLRFPIRHYKTGDHNWGLKRTDFWFNGPDGFVWHGYHIGQWTDIAHCKRTKEKVAHAS